MNETRRNGALRLQMLTEFPGDAVRIPLYIPQKRVCSCGTILSGYNRDDMCAICRSKKLSGEFERAAQRQARNEKTCEENALSYAINQGIRDGVLAKCACGCGEVFKVISKPGRPRIYFNSNCQQNARNRRARA